MLTVGSASQSRALARTFPGCLRSSSPVVPCHQILKWKGSFQPWDRGNACQRVVGSRCPLLGLRCNAVALCHLRGFDHDFIFPKLFSPVYEVNLLYAPALWLPGMKREWSGSRPTSMPSSFRSCTHLGWILMQLNWANINLKSVSLVVQKWHQPSE